jgi:hypothetical protein
MFRPTPDATAGFVERLVKGGHVSGDAVISFAVVTHEPNRKRRVPNPFSGEVVDMPMPSRRAERAKQLASPAEIVGHVTNHAEYDVILDGKGIPAAPPLQVGYVEGSAWKAMDTEYDLEIRCRVRTHTVGLTHIDREDDVHGPPDISKYRPIFDENASNEQRSGLFIHPEIGVIRIPKAACASFWIEFNYGKFVFPRAPTGSVDLLSTGVLKLARTAFNQEFVQACNWG